MDRFQFPAWVNRVVPAAGILVILGSIYLVGLVAFGASPKTTDVGYQPEQPVPFSHALHAGKLKMDCRYCHNTVETTAQAAVPPTATCVKCHSGADSGGLVTTTSIHANSPKLLPVRESYATGRPIRWAKVHDLPDYAYFDHSAHINKGVSCVSCHGRVDKMDKVTQVEPLSMSWCLDCHRNPEPHLRPREFVTALDWVPPDDPAELGAKVKDELHVHPSTNCSTCHR